MSNTNTFEDWAVILSYTRKQAIADGVLVDVTEQAKKNGFIIPVAITHTVWGRYIDVNQDLQDYGQSTDERLRDVLMVLYLDIRQMPSKARSSRVTFRVKFLTDPCTEEYATPELIAFC